jgi:hypothetical protein
MARKATDMVQLKLRFSEALRRRLERVAARNGRSMNTEIVHRLETDLAYETLTRRLESTPSDMFAESGATESLGAKLTAINEKLDKLIAQQSQVFALFAPRR